MHIVQHASDPTERQGGLRWSPAVMHPHACGMLKAPIHIVCTWVDLAGRAC